jgi:hypothetical protein
VTIVTAVAVMIVAGRIACLRSFFFLKRGEGALTMFQSSKDFEEYFLFLKRKSIATRHLMVQ